MSSVFLKNAVKYYASSALALGFLMSSKIVLLLALTAYIIYASIKS